MGDILVTFKNKLKKIKKGEIFQSLMIRNSKDPDENLYQSRIRVNTVRTNLAE